MKYSGFENEKHFDRISFYNGDCMDLLKQTPDKYYDLCIVDPPYGIGVAKMSFLKETKTTVKQKNGTRINPNRNKKKHTFKDWDNATPPQAYFDELRRISKNQIVFGSDYANWAGLGTGRIKWDKGFSKGVSFNQFEFAYCSCIDHEIEIRLLWAGMMQAKGLNDPMTQQGNKKLNEKRIHPCQKPVMLYDLILKKFSNQGDKILDTHFGSGSIAIAIEKANRINNMGLQFTGIELDEEYYNAALQRFKVFSMQQTIMW